MIHNYLTIPMYLVGNPLCPACGDPPQVIEFAALEREKVYARVCMRCLEEQCKKQDQLYAYRESLLRAGVPNDEMNRLVRAMADAGLNGAPAN